MTPEHIKTLLDQTRKLMYGVNYEVTLGLEIFQQCYTVPDINAAINERFHQANPASTTTSAISEADFWNDLNEKLDHRGHGNGSYLSLTPERESQLRSKQDEIRKFLAGYIKPDTLIYSYPFLEGIPGYPVFWEYCFVILNTEGQSILFYGSASD